MRLFPILTAILVVAALYLLVFERDRLLEFAGVSSGEVTEPIAATEEVAEAAPADETDASVVSVVAMRSTATQIDGAVILRGRTEAARQVDVRAETSGLVISDPLRKGAFVEAGDLLCRLEHVVDAGKRLIVLLLLVIRVASRMIRVDDDLG